MSEYESWQRSTRGRSFSGLGPLEVEVLTAVWDRDGDGATAREVCEELLTQRRVAYATVCLVLKNLMRKGLLIRDKQRSVFAYRAATPPQLVRDEVLDAVVAAFYQGRAAGAVSDLLGLARPLDEQQLEQLREHARMLQAR